MGIPYLFNLLFFILPLIFFTKTSEVFEFNKIVTVYIFTIVIVGLWIIKMILQRKIFFRRTILDIPILLFLGTQLISTILSIDVRTSLFGYYSRFNGGLFSSVSYALLYWAYVANVDQKQNKKNILVLMISGVIVSIYGTLEHFGHSVSCIFVTGKFDDQCWVQDVRQRVFATLGQPNWMAAFLGAIIPLTWFFAINNLGKNIKDIFKNKMFWIWVSVCVLFFAALLFTRSRSGLGGIGLGALVFWAGILIFNFWKKKKLDAKKLAGVSLAFLTINVLLVVAIAVFGTAWTPTIQEFLNKQKVKTETPAASGTTALETGGTESGEIRKIVWKGAFDIWKAYPITGSGVETFAFSYYQFRPQAHNLVSEWDFLYNKAHNEFLNYLSTTGMLGFGAYIVLIAVSSYQILKSKNIALFAGYVTILVTNFFGFSVVLISFLTFMFPAVAWVESNLDKWSIKEVEFKFDSDIQKVWVGVTGFGVLFLLFLVGRYWQADYLYSLGKKEYQSEKYTNAARDLRAAIALSPAEPVFHQELSSQYANYALGLLDQKEASAAATLAGAAISEAENAANMSPHNVVLKRSQISILINLSVFDPTLLGSARDVLNSAIALAPTDARLFFTLGKVYYRMGQDADAISSLEKAVELKPNYEDARIALEGLYKKEGRMDKAREQIEYILKYINPNNTSLKQELNSLGK